MMTVAAPRRGDDGFTVGGRGDNGRRDDSGGDDDRCDYGRGAMMAAATKLAVWTTSVAIATVTMEAPP